MFRLQILGCLLLGLTSPCVQDASSKSDAKVKATATATKIDKDGKQTVTITLHTEKGYYIFANPVGSEFFEESHTELTIKAKEKVTTAVKYPVGYARTIGSTKPTMEYRTYEGRTTIEAIIRRSKGDTSPLIVNIQVQAVHSDGFGVCLFPGSIRLTVP